MGIWNEVPEEVTEAGYITTSKKHVDMHMDRKKFRGIWGKRGQMDCVDEAS